MPPPAIPESRRCAGLARASPARAWPPFDFSSAQCAGYARVGERLRHAVHVGLEQRLGERVDRGRRAALVLAPDRGDLVRQGHRHPGEPVLQDVADGELVLRVQIREEQADRDRRRLAVELQPVERAGERVGVEGLEHAALLVQSLRDADAVPPAHERRRLAPAEVVVVLAVDALDVRDVLEALRRQVEDARTSAREHGVDPDRRPDDDELDVDRVDRRVRERGGDGRDGIVGSRGNLGERGAPLVVDRHEVGERAARVDADPDPHPRRRFYATSIAGQPARSGARAAGRAASDHPDRPVRALHEDASHAVEAEEDAESAWNGHPLGQTSP